jgi:hypothetical protein
MARYTALAPIYTPGGAYVEIGQTVGDEGNAADIPIPTSYVPPPCLDPLNADAVAKLTTAIQSSTGKPHAQPSPSSGALGLWGIRPQFVTLPLPAGSPSTAWKNLVKP